MRIGILTGGGDCPGLNAVIRAAVKTSVGYGWEVVGIEKAFDGLVHCRTRTLTNASVSGILHLGGTILGTTNAANQSVPIRDAIRQTKTVPLDHDMIESAREIGISFGD